MYKLWMHSLKCTCLAEAILWVVSNWKLRKTARSSTQGPDSLRWTWALIRVRLIWRWCTFCLAGIDLFFRKERYSHRPLAFSVLFFFWENERWWLNKAALTQGRLRSAAQVLLHAWARVSVSSGLRNKCAAISACWSLSVLTSLPCSHSAVFPVAFNLASRLIRTPEHLLTVVLCLKKGCLIIIALIN